MVRGVTWDVNSMLSRFLMVALLVSSLSQVRSSPISYSGGTSWLSCYPKVRRIFSLLAQCFWTHPSAECQGVCCCPVCAHSKVSHSPLAGLLRPLPVPRHPWFHIYLDFVTGLPPSAESKTLILVIIDHIFKMAHFDALLNLPSAKETAEAVLLYVFCIHGLRRT